MSFEVINKLLFSKQKNHLEYDDIDNFNAFLTTKTFSFYENGKYADYINDTLNVYGGLFTDKENQYKFYSNMIPFLPRKKITYIKTPKNINEELSIKKEFY